MCAHVYFCKICKKNATQKSLFTHIDITLFISNKLGNVNYSKNRTIRQLETA